MMRRNSSLLAVRKGRGVTASEVRGEDARKGGSLGWAYENPDVKLSLLWRAMQRSKDLHGLLTQDITAALGAANHHTTDWSNSGSQSLSLARHLRATQGYDSLGAEFMRYGDVSMPHRITLSFQRWAWSISQMHAGLMRGQKPYAETARTLHWLTAHVYPTHNTERLLIDPMVEVTAMMPLKSNPTGEQSPTPWMWVRDYDVETHLGVSFDNALKGRRLTKEQSLDFIKDLPYRRGALDDGGVSSLGRLTGKSSYRGVIKFEKAKAQSRTEGCPLAEDGSPTLDVAPLPTIECSVSTPHGPIPLWEAVDTVTGVGSEGILTSYLAHANFDFLTACCEGHARILSALYIEGRPVVVMSNNAAVVRYLDTVFGEYVEKGALEIVTLPQEGSQLDEVLGAVLQDDASFVSKAGPEGSLEEGEATQHFAQRHKSTWLLTDSEAQASKWGDKEVRAIVQYALQNGADTLCVGEYIGVDTIARLRKAIPTECGGGGGIRGRMSLLVIPNTPNGEALHTFVSSSVSTPNLTIIGGCGSVGSRTVESMSRGRTAREIALSPTLSPAVQTIGINIAATDALLYFPAAPYRLGSTGNTKRYLKATRSVIQHAMCPNTAMSSEGSSLVSMVGAGMVRRGMHKALWATDYSSGGIFSNGGGSGMSTATAAALSKGTTAVVDTPFIPSVGLSMSPSRTTASQREIDFLNTSRDAGNGVGAMSVLVAKVLGI